MKLLSSTAIFAATLRKAILFIMVALYVAAAGLPMSAYAENEDKDARLPRPIVPPSDDIQPTEPDPTNPYSYCNTSPSNNIAFCHDGGGDFGSGDFAGFGMFSRAGYSTSGGVGGGGSTPANKGSSGINQQTCQTMTANPVIVADGTKVKSEVDFVSGSLASIALIRTYNTSNRYTGLHAFGPFWTSNFDYSLYFSITGGSVSAVTSVRNDGSQATYNLAADGTYRNPSPDADNWIVKNANGTWSLIYVSGAIENYDISGFVTSTLDSMGIGWTYTYGTGLNNTQIQVATHTNGQTVRFTWVNGLVTSVTDPNGSVYTYTYNANFMLSSVTYPGTPSHTRTYLYENPNIPAVMTGILVDGVRYSTYSYYSNGQVNSSGLLDGSVGGITFVYGGTANNPTTTMTNAAGVVTTDTFSVINGQNKLTQVTQSGVTNCPSTMATTQYDPTSGHAQYSIDQRGLKTQYTFSTNGLLTDIITGLDPSGVAAPDLGGSQTRETAYVWDMSKNRLTEATIYGSSHSIELSDTIYTYYPDSSPSKNRLQSISVTNRSANGTPNQVRTTTYSYLFHASGMPSRIVTTGPAGQITRNYDTQGNITSYSDALNNTVSYSGYNGMGLPTTVTDPNGFSVTYGYDARGRVTSITRTLEGTASTTSYMYDGLGDLEKTTYPSGGWTATFFDGAGRPDQVDTNESQLTITSGPVRTTTSEALLEYNYNNLSKLTSVSIVQDVSVVPKNGGKPTDTVTTPYSHSSTYDSIGRLLADTDAGGNSTTYTYDADGNVATKTDALSHQWSYAYNSQNQLVKITDPLGHITQMAHDATGNVSTVIDTRGNPTDYAFDGFGDLVSQSSPDNGVTTFVYDSSGRRTQMTRADGKITSYTYDGDNRIKLIQAYDQSITYSYDTPCANGHGHLCSITDSSGSTTYSYRLNGQLTNQISVIGGTSYTTAWAYDGSDRTSTITYPGGNVVTYVYDTLSHVTSISVAIAGVVQGGAGFGYGAYGLGPVTGIGSQTYGYDNNFRLTSIGGPITHGYGYDAAGSLTSLTNSSTPANNQTLGYDALSRLSSVTSTGLGNQSITLDANGNRSAYTSGGVNEAYTPDTSSNRENSVSGSHARSYTFDTLGNTKTETGWRGSYTYLYDGFNRLTSTNNGATVYSYNGLSQRVRKTGTGGNIGFVYSPSGALIGETSSGGTALTTQYVWAGSIPIGVIRNGTWYLIHADNLNRPEVATDASANIVWQANNTAFDRTVATNTFGGLNLGFPGQYYDAESGLYYNGARYYDPTTGRYIQSDPIGLLGGMNPYLYASANPISRIDPLGLANFTVTTGISVEPVFGFEGTIGFYLSTDPLDAGTLYSSGMGVGFNNGVSFSAGYIPGSKDNILGRTDNVNGAAGPMCGTYSTSNGQFSGASVGLGAGPPGASVSGTNTVITGSLLNGLLTFGQGMMNFFGVPRGD